MDLQCNVDFFDLDTIGLDLNLSPCVNPASATLSVTDTKFNIHHELAGLHAGKALQWPIPGLSLSLPDVGEVGVVVDFNIEGNIAELDLSVGLDACGKIVHVGICGSRLHIGLPLNILSHTFNFSQACDNDAMFQEPLELDAVKMLPSLFNDTVQTKTLALVLPPTTTQEEKKTTKELTTESSEMSSSCSYASYKQCDSAWGKVHLGTSTNTICNSGCAMTSVTMFLQSVGNKLTPLQLNEWLISNGGYASKDLLIWGAVDTQFGVTFEGKNTSPTVSDIQKGLDNCQGLIANVRGGSHWVLITGFVSGTTFQVHDPGFNQATYDLSEMKQLAVYNKN
jgi:hypothetical protein